MLTLSIVLLVSFVLDVKAAPWDVEAPNFIQQNGSSSSDETQRKTSNFVRPTFSRYTPYLSEDSLPTPVFGQLIKHHSYKPSSSREYNSLNYQPSANNKHMSKLSNNQKNNLSTNTSSASHESKFQKKNNNREFSFPKNQRPFTRNQKNLKSREQTSNETSLQKKKINFSAEKNRKRNFIQKNNRNYHPASFSNSISNEENFVKQRNNKNVQRNELQNKLNRPFINHPNKKLRSQKATNNLSKSNEKPNYNNYRSNDNSNAKRKNSHENISGQYDRPSSSKKNSNGFNNNLRSLNNQKLNKSNEDLDILKTDNKDKSKSISENKYKINELKNETKYSQINANNQNQLETQINKTNILSGFTHKFDKNNQSSSTIKHEEIKHNNLEKEQNFLAKPINKKYKENNVNMFFEQKLNGKNQSSNPHYKNIESHSGENTSHEKNMKDSSENINTKTQQVTKFNQHSTSRDSKEDNFKFKNYASNENKQINFKNKYNKSLPQDQSQENNNQREILPVSKRQSPQRIQPINFQNSFTDFIKMFPQFPGFSQISMPNIQFIPANFTLMNNQNENRM